MSRPTVLVIDPEDNTAAVLRAAFDLQIEVLRAQSVPQAEHLMTTVEPAVIICRDDLPQETGIMFFSRYQNGPLWQRRILICPDPESELALFLINETQIFRCLHRPLDQTVLVQSVETALHEARRIRQLLTAEGENLQLRQQLDTARSTPSFPLGPWWQTLPRFALIVLLSFAGIFALGVITLLALYLLKSLLGIDLIPGAHLSDVWSD